jgi:formylglycine-generating enzyme required for sulfatase activity
VNCLRARLTAAIISAHLALAFAIPASAIERGLALPPISPAGTQVQGKNWLLAIGIDRYSHWPTLKTAVRDARAVRNILTDRYYFNPEQVVELYDEQATRGAIIRELRNLARQVGPEDSLVIYYAGHGHLDSITKRGSWIPVESDTRRAGAWLSNGDIKAYLSVEAIKAKHILLISDSCFAGDFFRGYRNLSPLVTPDAIKKAWRLTSRQVITSGGLEPVSDDGFGGHSVFAHFLLNALARNEKPYLISSDLFPDIRAGVAENADQLPSFGSLRDTGGQQGGELVLFLNPSTRAAVPRESPNHIAARELPNRLASDIRDAEIEKKIGELAKLDAEIAAMRVRLGTTTAGTADSMTSLLALAKEKKAHRERLDSLEEARREEFERIDMETRRRSRGALREDLKLYEEIAATDKEMGVNAWGKLATKYRFASTLNVGDVEGLREAFDISATHDMAFVEGGEFFAGCNESVDTECFEDERPGKKVLVRPFQIDRTEVTVSAYRACVDAGGCTDDHIDDRSSCNLRERGKAEHPINCVDYFQAAAYCTWAGKRLPTEIEWEKAARGTDGRKYPWGNIWNPKTRVANIADKSSGKKYGTQDYDDGMTQTAPVGSYPDGASPSGVLDMTGNVFEWTETLSSDGERRVIRGGSWNHGLRLSRVSNKNKRHPTHRNIAIGFRCAQ